ncbi:MAG: hypothetical protein KF878_33355 [Planctomycetes bacterium]|nr:hypothetical protein [Planctomycetota bacterium]
MVLRFSCPCGAPYTLADHLAGRTFTCTACGVVLKIGAPAGPPPAPPPSSDGLVASMEWSSEQKRPASGAGGLEPGLRPLDDDERRGASGRRAPPAAGGGAPLALADEEPEEADDEDEDDDDADEAQRPRRGPPSDARRSGSGRTSATGNLRTSGVTKGKDLRTSGVVKGGGKAPAGKAAPKGTSGRQRGRASADDQPAAAPRACPVCEAPVAASTVVCPSCGVRLKERSAVERMVSGGAWQGPVKGLVLLGLAGAIGFGAWTAMSGGEKRPDNRLTPIVKRPPSPGTEVPPATVTETASPRPATEATTPTAPTPTPPQPRPTDPPPPRPDRTPPDRPQDPRPQDPRPQDPPATPPRPDLADAEVMIIPAGPLEADFVRLRDAPPGPALDEAIAALASRPGVELPLQQALASLDRAYRLRVHRARLAAGDAAARRSTIEASLKGDQGVPLVYTVIAALELDAEGLRPQLLGLGYDATDALAGKAWAEAALERTRPRDAALAALATTFEQADDEVQRLLAPALAMGGDGGALPRCVEALAHPSAPVRALALAAWQAVAAGRKPAGGDQRPGALCRGLRAPCRASSSGAPAPTAATSRRAPPRAASSSPPPGRRSRRSPCSCRTAPRAPPPPARRSASSSPRAGSPPTRRRCGPSSQPSAATAPTRAACTCSAAPSSPATTRSPTRRPRP